MYVYIYIYIYIYTYVYTQLYIYIYILQNNMSNAILYYTISCTIRLYNVM